MNKKTKILSILLALALVAGGAACSKNDGETKDKEQGKDGTSSSDGVYQGKVPPAPRAFSDQNAIYGNENFGYLSLPKDWVRYNRIGDESGSLHYSSENGGYVVSLNRGSNEEFFQEQLNFFETNPNKGIKTEDVTIGDFQGEKTTGELSEEDLVVNIWNFVDNEGIYRSIMATGNPNQDYHREIEVLIEESFSLVNVDGVPEILTDDSQDDEVIAEGDSKDADEADDSDETEEINE